MNVSETILKVLVQPTPQLLWQLRGELLESGMAHTHPACRIVDGFAGFLNHIMASSSSRAYSHLASMLDIGAVGGVALQNLLERGGKEAHFVQRLLTGGLSESLMVFAARQYVRAFEAEVRADYFSAAWFLFGELWTMSVREQPDLALTERRAMIDQLLAPVHDASRSATEKTLLVGRLFQLLLVANIPRS